MQKPIAKTRYVVIATNPAGWQSLYIDAFAHSHEGAKLEARRELAKTNRDHWSVELVLVAS